ncbi:flagellar biosynthesis protein FlaG [Solibacillus silvestris]|nr:flagellar protein FlaG [Solibacillus silvestris]OBW58794.1 flagellar biosynthesis protein FlaG [Solibacillus silvestris]
MHIDMSSRSNEVMATKVADLQPIKAVGQEEVVHPVQTQVQQTHCNSNQEILKEKLQKAVESINEFFEINNSELKFVFHEGLEKFYVQLVNVDTDEVVREIPSKKMLDVFYEMQKLVGMIIDEKI